MIPPAERGGYRMGKFSRQPTTRSLRSPTPLPRIEVSQFGATIVDFVIAVTLCSTNSPYGLSMTVEAIMTDTTPFDVVGPGYVAEHHIEEQYHHRVDAEDTTRAVG